MQNFQWYNQLKKPSWAPPTKVFAPVWTILYLIIAITFGVTFYQAIIDRIPSFLVLPFILNLIFNVLFTPIQFGLKNNLLALIDILLVLITLVWLMVTIYPYIPVVSLSNIPYLLWVSFATVLQATITYLNRKTL